MNKKIILGLSLVLVSLFAIIAGSTFAWLTDTGDYSITYTVGEVSYDISISTNDEEKTIVPGADLVTDVVIMNKSNVATEIRVKTTAVLGDGEQMELGAYPADNETAHLLYTANENWTYEEETINGNKVEYFYYNDVILASTNTTDGEAIASAPFSELILNGWVVGNNFAGQEVTITLTFEVKQAANVTWAEMGSINFNFETGLENVVETN